MKNKIILSALLASLLIITGCGGGSDDDSDSGSNESSDINSFPVDTTRFSLSSLNSLTEQSCTLSNGTSTTCYSITVNGFPADRTELGPFCPQTTSTGAAAAGKWFDDGILYDLTGQFVADLSTFYGDSTWQLFNQSTGAVNITDTQAACEAAARPDVSAEFNNFCVECDIDYYSDVSREGVQATFLIPTTPIARSSGTGSVGNDGIGVAFNGVKIDAAAPTDAILNAYTIAAFDDCVGHVNPNAGYHYHGANHGDGSCPAIDFDADGHGGAFAYALDGYAVHSMLNSSGQEESDLDNCRGHNDSTRGYHYHTAGPGENSFIGCFTGETAQ